MGAQRAAPNFGVDSLENVKRCAIQALRQYGARYNVSIRQRLSRKRKLSVETVDGWIKGKALIPIEHLASLPHIFGIGFSGIFMDVLLQNGERDIVVRFFNSQYLDLYEAPHGTRTSTMDRNCVYRTVIGCGSVSVEPA